jgi:hypothetical protein
VVKGATEDVTEEELAEFDTPFYRLPIGWIFHTAVVIMAALLVWSVSGPGFASVLGAAAAFSVVVLGAVWLFRALIYFAAGGRQVRSFVLTPLVVVIAAVLVLSPWPAQARWAASRTAFDRLAADVAAGRPTAVPGFVGLYRLDRVQPVPGGWVVSESVGNSPFDDAGFAYLPGGPTYDAGRAFGSNPQFRHLAGSWYSWTDSW